jgi:NAD(P)-dependent dehydrogenase (short-subunit alcohol dehydrogenase family)
VQPNLTGKRALVTGGGRGIGAACARELAAAGAKVIVAGRTASQNDAVASEVGGEGYVLDLLDRAATDAFIAKLGTIDILVNNAGAAESAPLEKVTDGLWDRIMELDATAPFRLIRGFAPGMVKAGWGRVVNIASNAGVSGYRYSSAYCAAKHAMVGYTRALAIDLARTGVTINAICPGWVKTQIVDEAVHRIAEKTGRSIDDAQKALEVMNPQNRLLDVTEISHAVLMLCADAARGIHGQTLVIDGGAILK